MKISASTQAIVLVLCACTATAQTPLERYLQGIAWQPYQDRAVQLLQEYLRIDTSNPPGNELLAAEFFHRLFDEQGIPNTVYTYAPGRANLYAVLKGDGSLRPLVLLNHQGGKTVYGIGVAEKAPFWIRMTATGRGGHGSIPIADSAPNRLASAMDRVVSWETPIRPLPSVEQFFRQIAPMEKEPRASEFRNIRKALENPAFAKALSQDENFNYLLRDTVSLTVLKGSPQTNVIPDTAYCELDVRLLPGEEPQDFLAQLRSVVADDRIELEPITRFRKPNSSATDT